jgi:DNA repair exonuclease SbcCD ATPase subunit
MYGPTIERQVWEAVKGILQEPERFMEARKRRQGDDKQISETIRDLKRQLHQVTEQETKLMDEDFRDRYSSAAISQKAQELRSRRAALNAALVRAETAMATILQANASFEALAAMRERMQDRLDAATPGRQRWVLEALDTRVEIRPEGKLLDLGVPKYVLDAVVSDQKGQI